MATATTIEWTDTTWNPVTGCSKISSGCQNCYAERMATRLRAMGNHRYKNGFEVTIHKDLVNLPTQWLRPRMVFVNSMSDLFHEKVTNAFIKDVFRSMVNSPQHTFQILTKRSERLRVLSPNLPWPDNIWMGVSVENEKVTHRIDDLSATPAAVRFLSCEPLIGPLENLNLQNIDWVIVGGESGPRSRIMRREWVESILRQCRAQGVPFFFKQWGGTRKKAAGRQLFGRTYDEYPATSYVTKPADPYPIKMLCVGS